MRAFAIASPLRLLTALVLVAALGCSGDDGGGSNVNPDAVIRVNDASEEVLLTIADAVDNGRLTVDDARAAQLVTPEPDTQVPEDPPLEFAWTLPSARGGLWHGTTTGTFVWLRLSGGGLAAPIDVVAVDASSWTPDAATWAQLTATSGPITITLTTAYVDGGTIMEGPFRGTTASQVEIR